MLTINESASTLTVGENEMYLYSRESFEHISRLWIKIGWANKYCYKYTWLGRPILQLPEDMLKIQEIIFSVKPTRIIETGVAHGGSLIFYASILKMLGGGQIIGIDIALDGKNREEIEKHSMFPHISLIEGNSTDQSTICKLETLTSNKEKTLVILDSCHTKKHVLDELRLYSNFVSIGSYIIAADGFIKDLADIEGVGEDLAWNNPQEAVKEFLQENNNFVLENIKPLFNESLLESEVTYCPNAYLRRVK